MQDTSLKRRGLTLSAALLPAALTSSRAADVRPILMHATIQASLQFAVGVRDGVASEVWSLAEIAIKSVTAAKVKLGLLLLLAMGFVAGAVALAYPVRSAKQPEAKQVGEPPAAERKTEMPKPEGVKQTRTDHNGDPLPPSAIARIGTVRLRHGEAALRVTFSPDGKTLASVGLDGTLRRWDAATGKELWREYGVSNIAYAPDGRTFAGGGSQIGGGGGPIRLWDSATGREKRRFKGRVFAFSPDGNSLATVDSQNRIQLYDTSTGQAIRPPLKVHQNQISALLFSADGKQVVSAGYADKILYIWNSATGEELHRLQGHEGRVYSVALSPNGKVLASGSDDKTIRLWDMASGKELRRLEQPSGVSNVAFSHDGKTLAAGGADRDGFGFIQFWNTAEMKPRRRISLTSTFHSLAFAPDDRTLASAQGMSIRLWNTATGAEIPRAKDHAAQTYSLSVSTDGRTVAVGARDDAIRLCDIATGRVIRRLPLDHDVPATDVVTFSADGKTLVSAGSGVERGKFIPKGFDLWDLATNKRTRRVPEVLVRCLALSPDGKTVAGGVGAEIVLFETATGKELRRLSGLPLNGNALAFSPDGKLLASIDARKAVLWDVARGEEVRTFPGQDSGALAFSPDGKLLATTSYERLKGGSVHLWDVGTGAELRQMRQPRGSFGYFTAVVFAPDSRSVATGDGRLREHPVQLWEASTGQLRREWKGHDGRIWTVAFSPDGKRLLSGGFDTSVLIWDVLGQSAGQSEPLTSEQLSSLWADLADADAAKAYMSIGRLSASAKQAIPLLKDKLRPALPSSDPRQIARLVAALESEKFAVRQKAVEELRRIGEQVEPSLCDALKGKPTLEIRKRLEELLVDVRASAASPEKLRPLRAVEVLEFIGTPEAREILEKLAKGAPQARLTREAKSSLARLSRRPAPTP